MESSLRSKVHRALDIEPASPTLEDRVLVGIAERSSARALSWRRDLIASVAVLGFVAVVGGVFGALITHRSDSGRRLATAGVANAVPACTASQVNVAVSVERRIGSRFSFVQLTATDRGAACFLHLPVTVSLAAVDGTPLGVSGNGATAVLEGTLPRDALVAGFSWSAWCGSFQAYLVQTASPFGHGSYMFSGNTPPCPDAAAERGPSSLESAVVLTQPTSPSVRLGSTQPFNLLAHCGIQVVDFAGSFWAVDAGESIPAMNLRGTMVQVDAGHARFDYGVGRILLNRHAGPLLVDPKSQLCD